MNINSEIKSIIIISNKNDYKSDKINKIDLKKSENKSEYNNKFKDYLIF